MLTNLGLRFGEESWSDALDSVGKVFLCTGLTSQASVPQLLNIVDPKISPLCIECKTDIGSYFRWKCPLISTFLRRGSKRTWQDFEQQYEQGARPVFFFCFLFFFQWI